MTKAFSLSQEALETAISALCGASRKSVRLQFKTLAQCGFPGGTLTDTGEASAYHFPSALAMCAAFVQLNRGVEALEAAGIVQQTWPEWCRSIICAGVRCGLMPRPSLMPRDAGPVMSIVPTVFASGADALPMAVVGGTDPLVPPLAVCTVSLDVGPVLEALLSVDGGDGMEEALVDLDRTFGWGAFDVPMRADVAEMPTRRGFLADGPYFPRALALLDLSEREPHGPLRLWKLGVLSDYLQHPAPIEAWKRDVGDDENRPRLHHLLTVCAREIGLELRTELPHVLVSLAGLDARAAARDMILRAEQAWLPGANS